MITLMYLNEEWKDIPYFEGYYQGSTFGRIRSLDRTVVVKHGEYTTSKTLKGQILKQKVTKLGYLSVCLFKENKRYFKLVHRLIYESFNGKIPDGMQINHINELKTDNRLINLNLLSCQDNLNWGTGNARRKETRNKNKSYHYQRTVGQYDLNGNLLKTYVDAKSTGYCRESIRDCCQGKQKTAYGYVWKYLT